MKDINQFIIERLKLSKDSKITSNKTNIINKVKHDFFESNSCLKNAYKYDENNFVEEFDKWLSAAVDKYDYEYRDLGEFDINAPEPLDDYDVEFDYKAKNGKYYEFMAGPKILGYTINDWDCRYYFINKY